ncbi:MAG: cation:proton antiporter [Pseudomonadota bacterium]|nr:cation:proton antiporter [Pseudomonadota bacterium]
MTHEAALLLLVIAIGAVAAPSIGRWVRVPAAVVEILFGVTVGALGIADAESVPFVRFLADLGFALFLFLAGMEVDAGDLRRDGGARTLAPAVAAVVAFALAFIACTLLGWSPWVALAVGATSVPLLLSVIRETGLVGAPAGRTMITMAAVGEVVTVALVAFAEVLEAARGLPGALVGFLRLVALLAVVVLGTRVLSVLRWWFPERTHRLLGAGDAAETGVRAGFGLVFAMIAAAALAGVEPLLGAFVGGLMVSFAVEDKHTIEQKFGPMAYGFFVPVFFVDVGLRLDLHQLSIVQRLPQVLGICALMLVVKLVPNLAWLVVGRPLRLVLATSLLLAAPLTLVIAIADLAGRFGTIDEETEGVLVVAGMVASLVFPSLARRLLPR